MNEFDQWMKRVMNMKHYVRYADDFLMLSHDKDLLIELLPKIGAFLEENLKLSLHPDKVFIKTLASGVDFLGWVHFSDHRVLRTTTKRRMLRRVAERVVDKTNETEESDVTVTSYLGVLSHGNGSKLRRKVLDGDIELFLEAEKEL